MVLSLQAEFTARSDILLKSKMNLNAALVVLLTANTFGRVLHILRSVFAFANELYKKLLLCKTLLNDMLLCTSVSFLAAV